MASTAGEGTKKAASVTSEPTTAAEGASAAGDGAPNSKTSGISSSVKAPADGKGATGKAHATEEPLSCEKFAKWHAHLLQQEHRAELRDRARLQGHPSNQLTGLFVGQRRVTVHGVHEWVLKSPHRLDAKFPKVRERVNVWVGHGWSTAVVRHKDAFEVTLIMDQGASLLVHQHVDLHRFYDDSPYRWMCAALNQLSLLTSGPAGCLQAALFASPATPPEPPVTQLPPQLLDDNGKLKCFNPKLDPSQREAVEFALRQQRLAIVHGPAGTGKTTTAVEVILQHVQKGQRVLACAPSNSAVDNLLQKLGNAGLENMIRLGHPARIEEDVLDFWIDKWVRYLQDDWDGRLAGDWKRQPGEIELKRKVIEEAHVVLCTLAIANARGPLNLTEKGGMFDLLVIDEASQALEAECWLAIPRAKKLLLFGDPKQLSPVVKTRSGEKEGLSISLMERQMNLHGAMATRQLEVQYRMHCLIQGWSAERHYGGLLQPDPSVARHRLCELEGVSDTADTGSILLLIDTAGCQLTESPPDHTRSRSNVGEADLVAAHAAALAAAGLKQTDMAVVTPYNLQTAVVRTALQRRQLPNVEVNTVGGFQGREKEAVLLSLVRSNKRRDIGFIGKSDLVNVAVTRARRQLCIVCDSNTASAGVELASLLHHMREKGEVRSARAYEAQLSPEALTMFRKGL